MACLVFVEQVWSGSRIRCRALSKVDWVGRAPFAGKQGAGRHCCKLRQFKMVHTGKSKLGHPAAQELRSEKGDGTCAKQGWSTGSVDIPAVSRGFFHGQLFYTIL